MANMSKLSGIPPEELDMYHIWEIADHIMVNLPNGLPKQNGKRKMRKRSCI